MTVKVILITKTSKFVELYNMPIFYVTSNSHLCTLYIQTNLFFVSTDDRSLSDNTRLDFSCIYWHCHYEGQKSIWQHPYLVFDFVIYVFCYQLFHVLCWSIVVTRIKHLNLDYYLLHSTPNIYTPSVFCYDKHKKYLTFNFQWSDMRRCNDE